MVSAEMTSEKVDVAIVGAGAAASVYAAVLAEAGKSVRVLETGPARKLEDLYSSQIWARRLKWATPHVPDTGKNTLYFNFNAGRGFGGAAIHHYGVWPRYHEDDFKVRSEYGRALDWPIEYADLRPYYDRVQADVGVAGDAKAEIWRPPGDPYPLPPAPLFPQGATLARGFAALDLHVAPLPMAILTRPYKGRAACIWDGWCDAGCPIGSLANPLVHYFPRAEAAGAVLQADSHVTRVLTNGTGKRATGVEYYDAAGERQEIQADVVVLAAFAVENVRILLNSSNDRHPAGLANSSGLVGSYVTSHPAVMVFGLFDEELQNYLGATGGQLISQESWQKDAGKNAFGSRQWEIAQAVKPNDLLGIAMSRADLFHKDLARFMERAVRGLAVMTAITEDQPLSGNRIELDERKDQYGLRMASANYSTSDDGLKLWQQSVDEGLAIMKAAGAKEAWHGPQGAQHIMGGTIMGDDPAASVTNDKAQTHDVDNLLIGGAGVFPTSSAVNSIFTLHAVALRSAEYLRDNWAGIV
jgi:choline dehydrogenase-like flavoprotein